MNAIAKLMTSRFGGLEIDVLRTANGEAGITRKQLGEMLGYEKPDTSVANIHNRNKERFTPEKVGVIKMITPSDGNPEGQDIYVYTFKGVLEVCRFSNQPNANQVIDWAWEMLDRLRKGDTVLLQRTEAEYHFAQQKLRLFEEYNSDVLYDFDQVAAAMRTYRKPPFGASHLKRWLAEKNILCTAHYKNDKPIQRFIDNDWFRLVMHEYRRNGLRRYEPRYLITQRGFNGIIDQAIRERLIELPVPKHLCLPIFDEQIPAEAGGAITVTDELGNEVTIV
jgi:phage antirepressor YoqD-like protein